MVEVLLRHVDDASQAESVRSHHIEVAVADEVMYLPSADQAGPLLHARSLVAVVMRRSPRPFCPLVKMCLPRVELFDCASVSAEGFRVIGMGPHPRCGETTGLRKAVRARGRAAYA